MTPLEMSALIMAVLAFIVHADANIAVAATAYEHFDDYLISVAEPTEDVSEGGTTTTTEAPPTRSPEEIAPVDILEYFKDVPREHWSCCMLGKLAGDKGFHCHAEFYASRVMSRNFNRAQTRKQNFHSESRLTASSRATMRSFSRCVARHSDEFDKCCYSATVEREEIGRWEMYRRLAAEERVRLEHT